MLPFAILLASTLSKIGEPTPQVVDAIEYRLASNQCVQPLSKWWRHYAYSHRGTTDRRYVDVWFRRAGADYPAGRFVTEPQPPGLDDRQYMLVSAKYEIRSGRFVEFYCGLNRHQQ